MKTSIKKILLAEFMMLVFVVAGFYVPELFSHYKYLLFLCGMGVYTYFFIGLDTKKSIEHKSILKSILIYLIVYFIFIYLLGLFTDFARTIYSWSVVNFVKNIIPTTTVIIVSEVMRYQFIKKSNNDRLIIFITCTIFTLLDVCIGFNIYDLSIKSQLYQFIGINILGGISRNILMTILAVKSDFYIGIVYRLIMELYVFIVPIVPDLGLYLTSVFLIILPTYISYAMLNRKVKKVDKPMLSKKSNIVYIIVASILLILVGLNSGLFKYQTLVIGSNSMVDTFEKGDVVLIKKLRESEKFNLKTGDIIVFRAENKLIAHRIYKIYDRGEYRYYSTKGDNNSQVDAGVIENSDVLGIVKMVIRKVGLPSIWVNEAF